MGKSAIEMCKKQREHVETRPWWEPRYVIYGFSDPRVRNNLEKLMGTHIVQATNKKYMLELDHRRRAAHQEDVMKKVKDRMAAEVEREKLLILEGAMSMQKAPPELANHPVFRITVLANKILEERRLKEGKKKRFKSNTAFDYSLLEDDIMDVVEEKEMSCTDHEETLEETMHKLQELEEYIAEGEAFTEEEYLRIKHEDSLVGELQDLETVDDMYQQADDIVGPLTGKKCAGLIKR